MKKINEAGGAVGLLVILLLFWFRSCTGKDYSHRSPSAQERTTQAPVAHCVSPEQLGPGGTCVCGYEYFRSAQGTCVLVGERVTKGVSRSTKRPRAAARAVYNRATSWYDSLVKEGQEEE